MSEIQNLGYIVVAAQNLAEWERFATDIVGMAVASHADGQLALRIDEHPWRILVHEAADGDLTAIGWDLGSAAALDGFIARLRALNVDVREADPQKRAVTKLFVLADPAGFDHELYFGRTGVNASAPTTSGILRGHFVTGDLGMGHVVPISKTQDEAVRWYREVLGLRYSDRIVQEIAPGIKIDAVFFHAATGRHHSLATAAMPSPKKVNHFMLEYADMNDVGAAFDRARTAGLPIIMELGHHPNDEMFSFYVGTPSGFALELGYGGVVIDDAVWEPKTYDRLSDWGHRHEMPLI